MAFLEQSPQFDHGAGGGLHLLLPRSRGEAIQRSSARGAVDRCVVLVGAVVGADLLGTRGVVGPGAMLDAPVALVRAFVLVGAVGPGDTFRLAGRRGAGSATRCSSAAARWSPAAQAQQAAVDPQRAVLRRERSAFATRAARSQASRRGRAGTCRRVTDSGADAASVISGALMRDR